MYIEYFGFREKPFNVTPDPRFFYTNPSYEEAYASLLYGIHERKGFVVLTGEVGTGKTTLLRRLMNNLDATTPFAFLYHTYLTFNELLSFVCKDLGLPAKHGGLLHNIEILNEFLIAQLKKGGTGVLLIDEAQNLQGEVLEKLRLLSNLETASEKLLQIVLVGQPELEIILDQPKLRQLKQRVAVQCRLSCLKDREVRPYIDYRLNSAGYEGHNLFTPEAIQHIALYSKSIPRLINMICDNALLIAYAVSQKTVSAKIIEEVAHDLRLKEEAQVPQVEAPTSETRVIESGNGKENQFEATEDKPVRPRRRRVATAGVGIFLVLLFLSGGGVVFYPLQSKRILSGLSHKAENFMGIVEERLEFLKKNLTTSLAVLMSSEVNSEKVQPPLTSGHPAVLRPYPQDQRAPNPKGEPLDLAEQDDAAFSPVPYEKNDSGQEKSSSILVSHQPTGVKQESSSSSDSQTLAKVRLMLEPKGIETKAEALTRVESYPFSPPVSSGWKENPIVIEHGTTIYEIVYKVYGNFNTLAIDLIKEFNPHIQDLNRVLAGQKLWLPPLTQETLLRNHADGSYRLILKSFRSSLEANEFAQVVRQVGYATVITPRRVSDTIILYRVEIEGLKSDEAVLRAWDFVNINFIPFNVPVHAENPNTADGFKR